MLAGELEAFTSGCSHPPADLLLAKSDSSTNGSDASALPVLQLVTQARMPRPQADTPGPLLAAPICAAPCIQSNPRLRVPLQSSVLAITRVS